MATSDLSHHEIDLAIQVLRFCMGAFAEGDLEALVGGNTKELNVLVDRLQAPAELVNEPLSITEAIILKNAFLNEEDRRSAEESFRIMELPSRNALYWKLRSFIALRFEP